MKGNTTQQYTYNTQPHSAPRPGPNESNNIPLTMMSDPRVIRGNTYSLARKIAKDRTDRPISQDIPGKSTVVGKSESSRAPSYQFTSRPFALGGMDLSQYLVDNSENEVVASRICETQTDEFSALPPPRQFVPAKTGVDRSTQIDNTEDLFNFDEESVPLVEVIVRKTLEQALVEVNHEEEILSLQNLMEDYEMQRRQEVEWMKQQEENVAQDYRQVRGVVEKMQEQLKRRGEVKAKVAGLQMTRQILPDCIASITKSWEVPEEQILRRNVLPALVSSSQQNSSAFVNSSLVLDELLGNAVEMFDSLNFSYSEKTSCLKKLSVRLLRAVQEEGNKDDSDDADVVKSTRDKETVVAVVSVMVEIGDTAQMLESKMRKLLADLRTPPNSETNNSGETETEQPQVVNDFYPTFVPLFRRISEVIKSEFYDKQNLPYIPLTPDVQLSQFPLELETLVVDHLLN